MDFAPISEYVIKRLEELNVPSVAIGIQHGSQVVYREAFGLADVEKQIVATPETPYSIASVTKPMAATLVASLLQHEVATLDDPIQSHLPSELTGFTLVSPERATLKNVANHMSGLPLHYHFFFKDEPFLVPTFTETIRRYGHLVWPAGERYQYSNLGYGLLGSVIEQLNGRSLREVFRESLFAPLGMIGSTFDPDWSTLPFYATRYDDKCEPLPHYSTSHSAASDAFSSVDDLLKFGASHLPSVDSPLLNRESKMMMQASLVEGTIGSDYGFGWGLGRTSSGERYFGHSGGMEGVSTRLLIYPDRETILVVLSNRSTSLVAEIVEKLQELLGVANAPSPKAEPTKSVDETYVGIWTGSVETYEGNVPLKLQVLSSGSVLSFVDGQEVESQATISGDGMTGVVNSRLQTSDAAKTNHHLLLNLAFSQGLLYGSVTAKSDESERIGNALSHRAVLSFSRD